MVNHDQSEILEQCGTTDGLRVDVRLWPSNRLLIMVREVDGGEWVSITRDHVVNPARLTVLVNGHQVSADLDRPAPAGMLSDQLLFRTAVDVYRSTTVNLIGT